MKTYMELLSFLHSDLEIMLNGLFSDSYDFTGVVIVGRDATSALPEKATSILASEKLSTTCDQLPNLLAPSIKKWSEGEVVTANAIGTGLFGDPHPLATGAKKLALVAILTSSTTTPAMALATSIGDTLTSAAFELSMTQHKTMVQRTV